MKTTIVLLSTVSFFFFSYLELTSSQRLLEQCWTDTACNAEVALHHATRNLKYYIPETVNPKPTVSVQQKKLEETIPQFHQQLSTFVSF